MDFLMRDAYEKKLNIRRHISCLIAEVKDAQIRLSTQEERLLLEMRSREEAETKAKMLEEKVGTLHALLQEKDKQLQAVASGKAQSLMELNLRRISEPTQQTTEVSSTVELRITNCVEKDIFRLLLEKIDNIHCTLKAKEREVATLRKRYGMLSAYWRCKLKDLETKLEKKRSLDEGLKKKILKLEVFVHQSQSQLLNLKKIEAKRDETIKELAQSLAGKQYNKDSNFLSVYNICNAFCSKFVISISVTVILLFVLSRK